MPSPMLVYAILATLALIYAVPFLVYAGISVLGGLEPPGGSPARFLLGVLVSKIGTAVAFVLLFHLARDAFAGRWLTYALVWWVMFALGEIGQAIGPDYSWTEAMAGILSETIYLPASAFAVDRMLAA